MNFRATEILITGLSDSINKLTARLDSLEQRIVVLEQQFVTTTVIPSIDSTYSFNLADKPEESIAIVKKPRVKKETKKNDSK